MGQDLKTFLDERQVLVADGGMGTTLFEMGLTSGDSPELWNVTHPERVAAVHRGFVDAGADILLSNTFGGTASRLRLHSLDDRVAELNEAAIAITRRVADEADRPVVAAGSIGPTGELFEPIGPLSVAAGTEIFAEQATALANGGADVLWIETLSSREELVAAVAGAAPTGLPLVTTMSFDTNGKTMMGLDPTDLVSWWQSTPGSPVAIGSNCGVGLADNLIAAAAIHRAAPDTPVVVKGNCGVPVYLDGDLRYPTAADDASNYAELALDSGIRIIGACCGSVPTHIAQIRAVVDTHEPADEPPDFDTVVARLGAVSRPSGRQRVRRGRRRVATG